MKYRFPSGHGQAVRFRPVDERVTTPASGTPAARPMGRDGGGSPGQSRGSDAPNARRSSPSYVEIDVVEADLTADPRADNEG